jgi:hypothetical protein
VLTGLDPSSAGTVLAARARNATPAVRARLLAEANGEPLALLELPEGLSDAQLEGRAPLSDALRLSPRRERVFRQRAGRLPEAAQTCRTTNRPWLTRSWAGRGGRQTGEFDAIGGMSGS